MKHFQKWGSWFREKPDTHKRFIETGFLRNQRTKRAVYRRTDGRFSDEPWTDDRRRVDAAHQALPDKVPQAAFVNSEGLVHNGDKVHFDAASYRERNLQVIK